MSLELLYNQSMENKSTGNSLRHQISKNELSAFCNSIGCAPKQNFKTQGYKARRNEVFTYVKKNVPRSATYCPDCGYVLLWKRKV